MLRSPTEKANYMGGEVIMTQDKLLSLAPRTWLNDEVVNFSMGVMQQQNNLAVASQRKDVRKCVLLSSYFFSKLLNDDCNE